MSASPKSPRKETARSRQSAIVEALISSAKVLVTFDRKLSKHGKDAELVFTDAKGNEFEVTRKDIDNGWKQFYSDLKLLKNSGKGATKTARKSSPDTFKGVFIKVYIGPAIRTFIENGNFGPAIDGQTNLSELLPWAKAGFAIKQTLVLLFNLYMTFNNLRGTFDEEGKKIDGTGRMVNIDGLLQQALDGNISAVYKYGANKVKELETEGTNTFGVLRPTIGAPKNSGDKYIGAYIGDDGTMSNVMIQSIVAVNYMSYAAIEQLLRQLPVEDRTRIVIAGEEVNLEEVYQTLNRSDAEQGMLAEYKAIKDVTAAIQEAKKEAEKQEKAAKRRV